jgi:hypothetical protein
MTRPADWSPLASSDPVPGDPEEIALLGARLQATARQISEDVAYLRSLCTDQFWESEAGQAFSGKVTATAARLWQAHHRYLQAGEALGQNLTGPGYAADLHDAQSMSARALTTGQAAWTSMQSALSAVLTANGGKNPFGPAGVFTPQTYLQPLLDSSGNPVPMPYLGTDKEDAAAKRKYNGHATDLHSAITLLRQATARRDEAAAHAAAKILAAIDHDGLQDPTGFFHDLAAGFDDVRGFVAHNWARVVADIANICSTLASALGWLALIFACIGLPEVAAVLEGLAFTLTEITLISHLVLALTGHGDWLSVGEDAISLIAFGIGRSALRGAKLTVKVADELSDTSISTELDTLSEELSRGLDSSIDAGATDVSRAFSEAAHAGEDAVAQAAGKAAGKIPGIFGRLDSEALDFLNPVKNVRSAFQSVTDTDWNAAFSDGVLKTLSGGLHEAFRFESPEIVDSLKELGEVPELGRVARLTGIQFSANIVRYGQLWRADQIGALTVDAVDKVNSVLTSLGSELPGYNQLKEATGP